MATASSAQVNSSVGVDGNSYTTSVSNDKLTNEDFAFGISNPDVCLIYPDRISLFGSCKPKNVSDNFNFMVAFLLRTVNTAEPA